MIQRKANPVFLKKKACVEDFEMEIGTIIMMIFFLGFFWGGFIIALTVAFRKEVKKQGAEAK